MIHRLSYINLHSMPNRLWQVKIVLFWFRKSQKPSEEKIWYLIPQSLIFTIHPHLFGVGRFFWLPCNYDESRWYENKPFAAVHHVTNNLKNIGDSKGLGRIFYHVSHEVGLEILQLFVTVWLQMSAVKEIKSRRKLNSFFITKWVILLCILGTNDKQSGRDSLHYSDRHRRSTEPTTCHASWRDPGTCWTHRLACKSVH